jgi:serine/threonine protein kinase
VPSTKLGTGTKGALRRTTVFNKEGQVIQDRWDEVSPDGSPSRQSVSPGPSPADGVSPRSPRGRQLKPTGRASPGSFKPGPSSDVEVKSASPKKFPLRFSRAKETTLAPEKVLPKLAPEKVSPKLVGALSELELGVIAAELDGALSGEKLVATSALAIAGQISLVLNPFLNRYDVLGDLRDRFKYGTTGEDFANVLLAKLLGDKKKSYYRNSIAADREKALFLLVRAFSIVAAKQEQNKLGDGMVKWKDLSGKTFKGGYAAELGKGGFGKVLKYIVNDNLPVAVKQPLVDPDQQEYAEFVQSLKKQMSEVQIQTAVGYDDEEDDRNNVVVLYCAVKQPNGAIAMVMEEVPNGELLGIMAPSEAYPTTTMLHQHSLRARERAQNVLLCILKDILSGLSRVHRLGVAHNDFKPENIFIGDDGTFKVADFGEATLLKLMSAFSDVEEFRYLAAEIVLLREQASEQWKHLAQHSTWKEADEKLDAERTILNTRKEGLPETGAKAKEIDARLAEIKAERSKLQREYKKAENEAKNRVINESKKAQEKVATKLESTASKKVEVKIQEYLQKGNYLFRPQHADKWSLGVTIYYTLFGTPPFKSHRKIDGEVSAQILDFRQLTPSQRRQFLRLDPITDATVKKLAEEYLIPLTQIDMPMSLDDKVKDFVVELMFELLNPDPMQRPDLKTALDTLRGHPFFPDKHAQQQAREDILDMAHSGKPQ